MKYNKVFRILTLAVIFSLLLLAIPATPALAAASVDLSPTKGKIGSYVTITGKNFTPSDEEEYVSVDIYFSNENKSIGKDIDYDVLNYKSKTDVLVDDEGEFDITFKIPAELTDGEDDVDVVAGTYFFYVTYADDTEIRTKDTFTVIVPGISLSPTSGVVGTKAKITGSDFTANKVIYLYYDSVDITDETSGDETTDGSGDFSCTVPIPESTAGKHTITVKISSEVKDINFTVQPQIVLNPVSGLIGDSIRVTGTGFGEEVDVTIDFGTTLDYATAETDEDGSFTASFTVPSVSAGTFTVKATDDEENTAQANFTIATNITLSKVTSEASPGYVGDSITVSGTGFKPKSKITITYTSTPIEVATAQSDAQGAFSATFTVPKSEHGTHTITASDGINNVPATFYMESTAPAAPKPLLPEDKGKAKSRAIFDWEAVTDESKPVTYDLQVASDANFTTILVNKKELTTSEYTLTDEEKLESTKKDAPYYWRVRAVDAAANASAWTASRTFYVGFILGLPELKGGVLYGVIGGGVLLLFFLGFWAGRKSKGGGGYEY
jgi:hypothetical protein